MNKTFYLMLTLLLLTPTSSIAGEKEHVELQMRNTKIHVDYTVKDDLSVERMSEIRLKALNERAAKNLKQRTFSYSTSIERFEVIEAYTLKSNGDRINVPEGNYQITVNKGKDENGAIFSDRTEVTIIFPDFEVNDSVCMKLKNIETEPMFPNNFSASDYFWSQDAYDDVRITFDFPESLAFKYEVRDMEEKTRVKNGRKLIELTYQNKRPVKIDRQDFGVFDERKEAGYAISTFMDYESIAKAYGERAKPKSIPTERVKKLAQKVVAEEKVKREQARRLYDWVATNISYAGNCIGVGAVVPHDTDFILDNRMGDCKDHATLLEALYRSVGIESTQALINSGNSYELPKIPLVFAVNHVITYIPEWDQFVDSTNPSMPFDSLAMSISDKPVILVDNYLTGKKTPSTKAGDNYQEINSVMEIQSDGSVVGNIHFKLKGQPAIDARRGWRHVTQQQEDQWLKSVFSSNKKVGIASLSKSDPVPLLSEYSYSVEFNKPDFILSSGAGAFYIAPLLNASMSLYTILDYSREKIEGYDVVCANGRSIERLTYEFPKSIKILAKPSDYAIKENYIHFKASYEQDGSKLKVVREVNDTTPGNTCSAEFINKQRETLIKISEAIKAQVVYQH
ncbi:DUF3857 domain-containing transglutaminase family protein [Pseudomonadota bacterium]